MQNNAGLQDPQQTLARADALEAEGRGGEAEALYRRLLATYPGQPALLARLALVLKSRSAFAEAESLLRRAIAGAPQEAALHNNLGNVLREVSRFTDAEASYRKAIGLNPDYAEAHYNLGVVLEEQTRPDDALAAYRQAIALRPAYGAARARIGAILRGQSLFAEAVVELDAAVQCDPKSFEAHFYRGLALAGLERYQEAADALTHATALKPASHEAVMALAGTFRQADRHDDALATLWRAIELQPMVAATHDEINRLAWEAGRKDMFLKSFAFVRQQYGDNPALLFSEAQIRLQRHDANGAEPLLRRALEIEPERSDVNALLGRLLARRKRFDESFDRFATAIRVDPSIAAYRNDFGYALLQGKEATASLEQFEAARKINAVDQLALGGICLAYRALGDSRYRELVDIGSFVRVYPLSAPAGYADAQSYNDALAAELLTLHTTVSEPLEQTLSGGTQTAGLLFGRKLRAIEELREQISNVVGDYVRDMPEHASHPLMSRKQSEFSFTHSWSCKLRSSGFHTNHVHPMGWISSAYYVSLPDSVEDQAKKQGWLKFGESPIELGGDDRPEHFVRPIIGQLVLFPSYFWHGTVPFESRDDRLTVAFDVVPGHVDPKTIFEGRY